MTQYIGDIITIWVIVFAILIMLVMCSFIVQCSLQNEKKPKKCEQEETAFEERKLLE